MNKQQKQCPFVDLTNDRAFKAFFSNNEKLLLSLLKAFLPLPDKKTIHSFEFIKDKDTQRQSPQNRSQGAIAKAKKTKEPVDVRQQSLILTDPSLYTPSVQEKQVVLDLNVKLNTGDEKVNVEMHRRVGGDKGCFSVLPNILACKGLYFTGPGFSPKV